MHPANRLNLNYLDEATTLGPPPCAVIDVHTHINGPRAALVYRTAAEAYGIHSLCSMTHFEQTDSVSEVLGDRVHFTISQAQTDDMLMDLDFCSASVTFMPSEPESSNSGPHHALSTTALK
jgi:hypothetical protein